MDRNIVTRNLLFNVHKRLLVGNVDVELSQLIKELLEKLPV